MAVMPLVVISRVLVMLYDDKEDRRCFRVSFVQYTVATRFAVVNNGGPEQESRHGRQSP